MPESPPPRPVPATPRRRPGAVLLILAVLLALAACEPRRGNKPLKPGAPPVPTPSVGRGDGSAPLPGAAPPKARAS